MRDMIKTADKAGYGFFEKEKLWAYELKFDEVCSLLDIADSTETRDPLYTAIITAFRYGFVLGHRATVAGKIKSKL